MKNLFRLFKFSRLKKALEKRMTVVGETFALQEASETYARAVCITYDMPISVMGCYSWEFVEISFAFTNGYCKAIHDNGFEFTNGLVRKRDVAHEMPCGALEEMFREKVETEAITALQKVLDEYEANNYNRGVLLEAFKKEMDKKEK